MDCGHACCLAPRRWRRFVRRLLACPSLARHLALCNNCCEWYPANSFMHTYRCVPPRKLIALRLPVPKRMRFADTVTPQ